MLNLISAGEARRIEKKKREKATRRISWKKQRKEVRRSDKKREEARRCQKMRINFHMEILILLM